MKNNMENTSPLKARQSSRGGKSAGRATSTSSRRGGFGKSTGGRGKGGRNVGGYNVNTSFTTGSGWQKPPSGGIVGGEKKKKEDAPKADPAYTIDDKGKVVMTSVGDTTHITNEGDKNITQTANSEGGRKWVPGTKKTDDVYGTRKGDRPSYREAWDSNNKGVKDRKGKDGEAKYKTFEEFEADAIKYNEKHGKGEGEEERYLISEGQDATEGYYVDTEGGNITQSAFQLKGNPMYRNFGIGGKPKK